MSTPKRQKIEAHVKVSFLGLRYSYTYLAAKKFFSPARLPYYAGEIGFSSHRSISDVFAAVVSGETDYGIVPLESSTNGTIHGVYDQLLINEVCKIVAEIGDVETHCLCASSSVVDEREISHVLSHAMILQDCSQYLDALDERRKKSASLDDHQSLQPIFRGSSFDSAHACVEIARNASEEKNMTMAAICSKEAAIENGLQILASSIGNDKNAETRYIVIAKSNTSTTTSTENGSSSVIDPLNLHTTAPPGVLSLSLLPQKKATLVLALKNAPGAIFKMSSCFALRDIDILKIESRPANTALKAIPAEARAFTQVHWSLVFHVDYTLPESTEKNDALIANLLEYSIWLKEFGQYYSGLQRIESQPQNFTQILELL